MSSNIQTTLCWSWSFFTVRVCPCVRERVTSRPLLLERACVCACVPLGSVRGRGRLGGAAAPAQRGTETQHRASTSLHLEQIIQAFVEQTETLVVKRSQEVWFFLHGHKMKGLPGCILDLESYFSLLRLWHQGRSGRAQESSAGRISGTPNKTWTGHPGACAQLSTALAGRNNSKFFVFY